MANLEDLRGRAFALTGNTGSGKSTVANLLQKLGAHIISADELARAAAQPGTAGYESIRKVFGEQFLHKDGQLDRKKLGHLVFKDPLKKTELEKILHPEVQRLYLEKLSELNSLYPADVIIYDVPLYYETDLDRSTIAYTIVVFAPREDCIRRIMIRDSLPEADAAARYDAQISIEEKVSKADFVINNTSNKEALESETKKCFSKLKELTLGSP